MTDLVEVMAEQTGRTLQWKNRVQLSQLQLQSSSRLATNRLGQPSKRRYSMLSGSRQLPAGGGTGRGE